MIVKAVKLVTVDGRDVHRFNRFHYELNPKHRGRTTIPANCLSDKLKAKHIERSTEQLGIQTEWVEDGTTEVIFL